jgi:hypothetical protein
MAYKNPKSNNPRQKHRRGEVQQHDSIRTLGGGIEFQGGAKKNSDSEVPTREQRATIYSGNNQMYMTGGGIGVETHGTHSVNAGDIFHDAKGDLVEVVGGTKYQYKKNDDVVVTGEQTDEQIKAAKNLSKTYEQIEQKKEHLKKKIIVRVTVC